MLNISIANETNSVCDDLLGKCVVIKNKQSEVIEDQEKVIEVQKKQVVELNSQVKELEEEVDTRNGIDIGLGTILLILLVI